MGKLGHNSGGRSAQSLTSAETKKIKDAVKSLNDSMTRAAAEKQHQKDVLAKLEEELGVDKKMVNKVAKAYFQANVSSVLEENELFQAYYERIMVEGC